MSRAVCAKCGKHRSGKSYHYYYGVEVGKEKRQKGNRKVDVVRYQITEKTAFICNICALRYGIWIPLFGLLSIIPLLSVAICSFIYLFEQIVEDDFTPALFYLFLGGIITIMGLSVYGFAYLTKGVWRWNQFYEKLTGRKLPFANKYAMEVMAMELDPPGPGEVCFTSNDYQKLVAKTTDVAGQSKPAGQPG